ncbi:MAG: MBL fold metallo-hydrolase [Caldilineaceae bacterium]|nr:MBL fold metallo-hydrolase [Caldilineaceae bacterium]
MSGPQRITYLGHATLLIETEGVRLLTDPLLRNWVWHLRRRTGPVDPKLYQNLDAVLISHMHWDHLDLPSLRLLDPDTHIIAPHGAASLLHKNGFRWVTELGVGDTIDVGSVPIMATYAMHDGARVRYTKAADCLGYLIGSSYTVYFAGDTELFPEMADLASHLDVALLPVWGWGPTLGRGHMDPQRAAQAAQLLQPRVAIPIHWGTLFPFALDRVLPKFLVEPPELFASFTSSYAPNVRTKIVPPGDAVYLRDL